MLPSSLSSSVPCSSTSTRHSVKLPINRPAPKAMSWTILYRIYGLFHFCKQDLDEKVSTLSPEKVENLKEAKRNGTLISVKRPIPQRLVLTTSCDHSIYVNNKIAKHLTYSTPPIICPSWWVIHGIFLNIIYKQLENDIEITFDLHTSSFPPNIDNGDLIANLTNYFSIFFNVFSGMEITEFPNVRRKSIFSTYTLPDSLPMSQNSVDLVYQKVLNNYNTQMTPVSPPTTLSPSSSVFKRGRSSQTSSYDSWGVETALDDTAKRQRTVSEPSCSSSSSAALPRPLISRAAPHMRIDYAAYARIHALSLMLLGMLPEVCPHTFPQPIMKALNEFNSKHSLIKVLSINGATGEMFISIKEIYDIFIYRLARFGSSGLKTPSERQHDELSLLYSDVSKNRPERFLWWSEITLFGKPVVNYLNEGETIINHEVLRRVSLPKPLLETKYFKECIMQNEQPCTPIIADCFEMIIDIIQPKDSKAFSQLGSLHENFQTEEYHFANGRTNDVTAYESCINDLLIICKQTWMSSQK